MNQLLAFSRAVDWVNERLGVIANWAVLISCLISAGNAMSRYAISVSSNAWLEIQWYLFGAMFMLGASYTLKMNEHVRVDIIYGNISVRAQLWVDILGYVVFMLPSIGLLAWLSWPIFHNSWVIQEMSTNAGGLIRWPVKLLLPVGFLLLTLQGLSELIKRLAVLTGHLNAEFKYEKPLQ